MNGNISWMYQTELESLIFLVKTAVEFRNVKISKIPSTYTNRIFPILFKVVFEVYTIPV